jgi:hypothetical protein
MCHSNCHAGRRALPSTEAQLSLSHAAADQLLGIGRVFASGVDARLQAGHDERLLSVPRLKQPVGHPRHHTGQGPTEAIAGPGCGGANPGKQSARIIQPGKRRTPMNTDRPTRLMFTSPAALCAALLCTALGSARAQSQPLAAGAAWEVAGRQGLIQVVIVPQAQARDREAYARQVALLCQPQLTCFINFFSNSTGAPLSVPLPDAIAKEPTALFRRSTKQGAELFRWSCRMGSDEGNCF